MNQPDFLKPINREKQDEGQSYWPLAGQDMAGRSAFKVRLAAKPIAREMAGDWAIAGRTAGRSNQVAGKPFDSIERLLLILNWTL